MNKPDVRSIYKQVTALAIGGTEVTGLLGGVHTGYIRQVVARASTDGGTDVDVAIRLKSGETDTEYLVYSTATIAYPLIDSAVDAPFDTGCLLSDGDLSLYVEPQANGVIEVRVDIEIIS